MAKTSMETGTPDTSHGNTQTISAHGAAKIDLPSAEFITDAHMTRDGDDLVLTAPNGETIVIDGYFSASPAPTVISPDGAALTPNLVDSFSRSSPEFAAAGSANDESPVGAVEEVKGHATVTRADGTVETIAIGTPIYQGDIVQTDAKGAVNITFVDETSMAISENAKLAVDEYTFDPKTESGTTNFSVLRGLFVFTSGLIGRDDPDDVKIDTPVGSIGIRGTIIAGEIHPGGESKISVLEGAIVVTNGVNSETLSKQFETVRLSGFDKPVEALGVLPANDIGTRFHSVGTVLPSLFTIINETAHEQSNNQSQNTAPAHDVPAVADVKTSETVQQQAAPTIAADPVQTAPAPAPAAAPVQTVAPDTGVINLNGSITSLPTTQTATGQSSVTPDGTVAGSNTFSTSTAGSSTPAPPPASVTAPATAASAPALATPTGSVAPPTILQPPPSVIGNAANAAGSTAGGTTATPPSPALQFTANSLPVTDIASAGYVIGTVSVLNATGTYGFTFGTNTTSSANNYYTISSTGATTAQIILTTAGAAHLAGSLDNVGLEPLNIKAVDSATTSTLTLSSSVSVTNANGASTFDIMSWNGAAVVTDGLGEFGAAHTISALGDVNHDGFDDFVFSNNSAEPGQNHSYILSGGGGRLTGTDIPGLISGGKLALTANPTYALGDYSDTQVAGVGDFNGDGKLDYVIGQPNNGSPANGEIAIVSADGTYIRTYTATTAGSMAGMSVSGIGDFNNDGRADVIVGAPGANSGTGKAYLFLGTDGATGTTLAPTDLLVSGSADMGTSVTGIGDFNGDGYSDFAIGAPGTGGNGAVFLYYGGSSASVTTPSQTLYGAAGEQFGKNIFNLGDINGDGKTDIMVGGDNTAHLYFGGGGTVDVQPGTYSITGGGGIGDFNGDGYNDFAVSLADGSSTHTFVVFGKDGMENAGALDLNYLKNPGNAIELINNNVNSGNELKISGVGDTNGDGYDDFAIGYDDMNGAATGNGGFALVYGHTTSTSAASTTASGNNQALVGSVANDTFDDGGFQNISMRGGAGQDLFRLNNTDFLSINGGGNQLGAPDAIIAMNNLDFSGVNMEKISGIEKISLGSNTVTLTMENLFNLLKTSDTGSLTLSGTGTLVLSDGATGDSVAGANNTTSEVRSFLDAQTSATVGTPSNDGAGHNVFEIGGYKLLIDTTLAVDAQ